MNLPKLESSRNVTSQVVSNPKQGNQNPQNNMIASFSFASTAHVTQWSNYLTQRAEIFTRGSNLTPQWAKNTVVANAKNHQAVLRKLHGLFSLSYSIH